ncbi:AraC-like DNA-binding protein [Paenibacillus mucilaginosus]
MPRYLYRLLVFTLLLVAAPVVSIGMISYYIASKDTEQKVNEGNTHMLLQNQMRIEQVLKHVEMGAVQYVSSSLVTDHLYDDLTPDDFVTITDLAKGLYNLHSLSGVADTHLVNLEHDWMISNLGFTKVRDYLEPDLLSEYSGNPKNLFWLAGGTGKKRGGSTEEEAPARETVRMVVKLPMIAPSSEPKALLIIDMDEQKLESDMTPNEQWGNMYVVSREGLPFLTNPGSVDLTDNILIHLKTLTNSGGYFEADGMAVNYRVSPYNQWTYASINSIESMTKESRKIAVITLNACLIIFVIIAAGAYYGSRRMYSPFRRLFLMMERYGGEAAVSRQQDEFAYIEDRFNSLFRTRKQLQTQLQGQRGQMREFFVLKLLMGQITESEFTYKSETYGFAGKGRSMGVLTLQIDALHETRFTENDKELLLFAINNMVGELIPSSGMLGNVLLDQSQISILISDSDDPDACKAFLHQTAAWIKTRVYELLQLKVSIGISRSFTRYTDANHAYTEALEALKRRISLGNDIILHYDDMKLGSGQRSSACVSLEHFEDDVIHALKVGDSVSTAGHYDRYVEAIMEKEIGFNDFQMVMLQLVNRVYRLVNEQEGSLHSLVRNQSILNRFVKLHTASEMTAWFKQEFLPPILEYMRERVDRQYINIAHEMVQLIHEQYGRDLTLDTCAERLKYHPVYLSRVFKKEIGVTFIDYLTDYRMKMAKSWLENTDLKITEIAGRLNYTNATGFIRTFRKLTGMTPGQYRDSHSSG